MNVSRLKLTCYREVGLEDLEAEQPNEQPVGVTSDAPV